MTEEYQLTFNDYLSIAKRRWLHFSIPFVVLLGISAIVAVVVPPIYKSTGIILVESQQIPTQIVQSTVTGYINERIQILRQRIMTRDNLFQIVNKYRLFQGGSSSYTISEQVDLMRSHITVAPVQTGFGGRSSKGNAIIAFEVSFENREPVIAQAVANDLVTLFLDENVKTRTERVEETTEFLTDEVKKLKVSLEKIEGQIVLFKEENSESLPENLALNTGILERTEQNIKNIEKQIESSHQEISFLEIELSAAKKQTIVNSGQELILTPEQKLTKLELEYSELISGYTENHPDVKRITREIESLKKEIEASPNNQTNLKNEQNIDIARIRAKIEALNKKITTLTQEKKELENKRVELEKVILQTPHVKNALLSLTRDYDNTLRKYKDMQAKQMEADLAVSLEEKKKSERFSLIDPPQSPDKPVKPNRAALFSTGALLSLLIAAGFVFFLEVSNQRIWGEDALTRILMQRPLVSVPYIETLDELEKKKSLIRKLVVLFVVLISGVLLGLHFLYMPLDMIFYKVLARLG